MIINTLFYFILPWLIALFVIRIDIKIILVIAPFAAIAANILNTITVEYNWVDVTPYTFETNFESIPMVLGIIPVFSSIFISIVINSQNDFRWFLVFSIVNTLIEWIFLWLGLARYTNGWNIGWTFVVYLVGYGSVYGYYRLLCRWKVI
ncbi:hypothetical protein E2R51_03700 [Jeotgalibacillus sp. S-D1]|uniref:CBO0543 family protein n=1 Tax=Jeotgalibacillus sp. S-D1 TaxID=2552189 RepID=UPI0010599E33|nr:CBO0543 family protein [Jeotgalibacillus sp. S-D1]TDL34837.1 hypothetical protein E2R51_03700 [Jeotgalibacillus sp. S-D1]